MGSSLELRRAFARAGAMAKSRGWPINVRVTSSERERIVHFAQCLSYQGNVSGYLRAGGFETEGFFAGARLQRLRRWVDDLAAGTRPIDELIAHVGHWITDCAEPAPVTTRRTQQNLIWVEPKDYRILKNAATRLQFNGLRYTGEVAAFLRYRGVRPFSSRDCAIFSELHDRLTGLRHARADAGTLLELQGRIRAHLADDYGLAFEE